MTGERVSKLNNKILASGLKTQIITYGEHTREQFINACQSSKVVAWMAIEDYCSNAQIESHLCGACVIGTPWNLTINAFHGTLCKESQVMSNEKWIEWNPDEVVVNDYFERIIDMLKVPNLSQETRKRSEFRHSFETYRKNVKNVVNLF